MMHVKYDVCMVGMGAVGTISGLCFARQGFHVVGTDSNAERVQALAKGSVSFSEPGITELLQECRSRQLFHVSEQAKDGIANARIIMIAVGTPFSEVTGDVDLAPLEAAAKTIGEAIRNVSHEPIIVMRATVAPGTMRNHVAPIIAAASGKTAGEGFHLACNPEFMREGKAIKDFFSTGRVVIGADHPDIAEEIQKLHKEVEGTRKLVSIETAEFAKYVDNSWHAVKVTFANEVARLCRAFGGNPQETSEVFLADTQLNLSAAYLRPGSAFGGSFLPKDTRALIAMAGTYGVRIPMIDHLLESNAAHIHDAIDQILSTHPRCVGVLGCAFKEGSTTLEESPALLVASRLMHHSIRVMGHDAAYTQGDTLALPEATTPLTIHTLEEIAEKADMLVIMHNLPAYRELVKRNGKPVVDLTIVPMKMGD
jgi:GDP-mannose 6-dehydrogenase